MAETNKKSPVSSELEAEFQSSYDKITEINKRKFTDNDFEYLKKLNRLYGNTLSAKGLNLLDPITASMFHYNKMGTDGALADPQRVTRSYVFFSRPEMNFSFENINTIPFFKWLHSKRIGKMIMTMLTDPSYYINAPNAMNTSTFTLAEMQEVYDKMKQTMDKYNAELAANDPDYAKKRNEVEKSEVGIANEADFNVTEEDLNLMSEEELENMSEEEIRQKFGDALDGINLDELSDETATRVFGALKDDVNQVYSGFDEAYESLGNLHTSHSEIRDAWTRRLLDMNISRAADWMNYDVGRPEKFNYTSPWIVLLGNRCIDLDGAKEPNMEHHSYEEDKFSSNLRIPKGFDGLWSSGEIPVNFKDIAYSPVGLLFMVWMFYIHYVSRGFISPTREHVSERVLDYTCSIYAFVLGEDGRRIERWAKWTGCYPTNFPFSSQILHKILLEPDMLQNISITFAYNRYEPMDPQVFTDFNFLSESEWLVKLRPNLWERLYDRNSSIDDGAFYNYYDSMKDDYGWKSQVLRDINRPAKIWEPITPETQGMSGKPPPALVESDLDHQVTDYWGGYPYINIDTCELIWVMPEYTDEEVIHDKITADGSGRSPDIIRTHNDEFNSKEGMENLMRRIKMRSMERLKEEDGEKQVGYITTDTLQDTSNIYP